jgi:hypothetical protein
MRPSAAAAFADPGVTHGCRPIGDVVDKVAHAVSVGRRAELLQDLRVVGEQADVDAMSTQVDSSVQLEADLLWWLRVLTLGASHRRGPPSSQLKAAMT